MNKKTIGILGGGIMGSCLALELAQRNYNVDLYDIASLPMTAASLHNEGKLHLGFVYANDPTAETHRLMIKGSLSFSHILKKLTGYDPASFNPSKPFYYFIPNDSQLNIETIQKHFERVENTIKQIAWDADQHYLGLKFDSYFERNSTEKHAQLFSQSTTSGSFNTEERSVSTIAVAQILRRSIVENNRINFYGNTQVIAAKRCSSGDVEVELKCNGKIKKKKYCSAVNCLWDDKLRVDQTAGINTGESWIMRYKAMISIDVQQPLDVEIPSATGILGSYGDIVNHHNGSYYLSWYPLCKRAQTLDNNGRELHDLVHKHKIANELKKIIAKNQSLADFVSTLTHKRFINNNINEMAAFVPSISALLKHKKNCKLTGGVIIAKGATDIDDPKSYLHQRSVIGPTPYGSYLTIDTGKYCTAPMFAIEAADIIDEIV